MICKSPPLLLPGKTDHQEVHPLKYSAQLARTKQVSSSLTQDTPHLYTRTRYAWPIASLPLTYHAVSVGPRPRALSTPARVATGLTDYELLSLFQVNQLRRAVVCPCALQASSSILLLISPHCIDTWLLLPPLFGLQGSFPSQQPQHQHILTTPQPPLLAHHPSHLSLPSLTWRHPQVRPHCSGSPRPSMVELDLASSARLPRRVQEELSCSLVPLLLQTPLPTGLPWQDPASTDPA